MAQEVRGVVAPGRNERVRTETIVVPDPDPGPGKGAGTGSVWSQWTYVTVRPGSPS